MYWTIHCWRFYILSIVKANIAPDKVKQRRKNLFKSVSIGDRKQIGGCLGDRQGSMVGAIGKFRVLNVFTILIVMMVSWVCTYVKAPNCTFRYVQLIL